MKNLFFIALILFSGIQASSQKTMYLYFESENQVPFYLKIDDKVYTSVAPGYYVLSGLGEGKYRLSIGIPSESRLENRFEIDVRERDRGLLIRKQGQGLILQDMHDGTSVKFIKDPSQPEITYEPRTDAFTQLLAKASGDPGLLMSPVFAKVEPAAVKAAPALAVVKEPSVPVIKEDVPITSKTETNPEKAQSLPAKNDSVAVTIVTEDKPAAVKEAINDSIEKKLDETASDISNSDSKEVREINEPEKTIEKATSEELSEEPYIRSKVTKFAEGSTSEGFSLVYIDIRGVQNDTIRIMIPNPKYNLVNNAEKEREDKRFLDLKEEREIKERNIADSIAGKPDASPTMKKVEIVIETNPKTEATDSSSSERNNAGTSLTAPIIPKINCKTLATDNDFFKLRKNMASHITDESMVAEAKKSFRNKCFFTEQIRNLSSLFLTSAGKYLFFDAAFLHVSDQEQFVTLGDEIKDDYYKKRFNALIGL